MRRVNVGVEYDCPEIVKPHLCTKTREQILEGLTIKEKTMMDLINESTPLYQMGASFNGDIIMPFGSTDYLYMKPSVKKTVILSDANTKKAVVAVNIAYKDPKTGKLVGGTISQPNGMALIDSNYDIEISHVSYKPVKFKAGTTIPYNIYLEPMVYEIPEVVVTPAMQQNKPKPQKQNQTVTHEPSLNNEVSKWKKYAFIGGGLLLLATVGLVIASKGKKK